MARAPHARRKQLRGKHEGGAVGSEVCEEERQPVEKSEEALAFVLEVIVPHTDHKHEERHHEEAHELDLVAPQLLDEENGEPVTGEGPEQSDNEHGT